MSDVWKSFTKVYIDKEYSGFVMCKQCKQVLKWKSKDGTSGLKGHNKSYTVSDKPQAVFIKQIYACILMFLFVNKCDYSVS